jgi:hypothetical protein
MYSYTFVNLVFVPVRMMKYLEKPKYDSILLGTIIGLLAPVIVFLTYYLIVFKGMNFSAFYRYLSSGEIFLPVISLCNVPNLLIFFIFIWTKRDKSARGVLQATFIYAIYICIMKLT